MVVDRQKIITRSESRRYRVAGRLEVRSIWSGRRVRSQGRQVSTPGGLAKNREKEKAGTRSNTLLDLTKQDELAQTDRQKTQV